MRQNKDRLFHEQEYSSDIYRTSSLSTCSLSLQKDHILNCEGKLIQENVGANLNQSITHFEITIYLYIYGVHNDTMYTSCIIHVWYICYSEFKTASIYVVFISDFFNGISSSKMSPMLVKFTSFSLVFCKNSMQLHKSNAKNFGIRRSRGGSTSLPHAKFKNL